MQPYIIPNWPAPQSIRAVTTLRFSHDHARFSMSTRSDLDSSQTVAANRKQLRTELGLTHEPIWLRQFHSAQAVYVHVDSVAPEADAAYTDQQHVACTVLTADCVPILLCNTQGTQVAAIHAGWRGILTGVIEATVAQLQRGQHWLAWLGPAISVRHFEVGDELYQQFTAVDQQAAQAFYPHPSVPGKWFADLYLLASQRLMHCGIRDIYGGDLCTFSDPERFFSYRRDQHVTGNMASLIWIT